MEGEQDGGGEEREMAYITLRKHLNVNFSPFLHIPSCRI